MYVRTSSVGTLGDLQAVPPIVAGPCREGENRSLGRTAGRSRMGPYDLGRRRTRERQLLRSGGRKGPQPRGIRDAKARAERRVGYACLRRRTGSGKPQGSTGSDGSAGPRFLGRAQSSAAHGRIRGWPSSTRGRSRMDERPCPDLCGGCAVLRIPTVTGGRGSATTPPTRLECAFRHRSARNSKRLSTVPEPPGVVGRRFCGWQTRGATAANSGMSTSRAAWVSALRRSNACASVVFWRVWRPPPPGAGEPPTETPGRGEGGEAVGSGRFFPARRLCSLDAEAAGRPSDGDRQEHLERNGTEDSEPQEIQPWLKPYGCLPPSRNAPFVAAMEEVLDTYQRDFAEDEVLVCMDETRRQQTKETRLPRPVRPG